MATRRSSTEGSESKTRSRSSSGGTATRSARSSKGATHDMIAKRAFELYIARGRVEGFAEQDWRQAEHELMQGGSSE